MISKHIVTITILLTFIWLVPAQAQQQVISLEEFIQVAAHEDKNFEGILLEKMIQQYQSQLNLPVASILMNLKGQYTFSLQDESENAPQGSVGLSKLFPAAGTSLEVDYSLSKSNVLNEPYSTFTVTLSQPIAENAFGHVNRLLDKINGLEMDLAHYQVVEAYEDYLAQLMKTYYTWYASFAHLQAGKATLTENQKLLKNIRARQRSKIANQTDVNKIHLQVLEKQATVISLKEASEKNSNIIYQAVNASSAKVLMPRKPGVYKTINDDTYTNTTKQAQSRTQVMLDLLTSQANLEMEKYANQLLPSAELQVGYNAEGTDEAFDSRKRELFAGLSLEMPFFDQQEAWQYKESRANLRQTSINSQNKKSQFETDIKNLYMQLKNNQLLIKLAEEKVSLAEVILKGETKYYIQGRAELNDLILAANRLEDMRYQKILLDTQYNILVIEWLRLTDQLVKNKDLDSQFSEMGKTP